MTGRVGQTGSVAPGRGITRGAFLAGVAAGLLAPLLAACGGGEADEAPALEPVGPAFTGTLRVLGTPLELQESIRRLAERDLGFGVRYETGPETEIGARAIASPTSFDVLSGSSGQVADLVAAGAVAALERSRLPVWPQVMSLYKLGSYRPGGIACAPGGGDAPFRRLYAARPYEAGPLVQWGRDDGTGAEGPEPAAVISSPGTLAIESFAYNSDALRREPLEVSWRELLNRTWSGRVALPDDYADGFQQAALAAGELGLLAIEDPARPTRSELDALAAVLGELRRAGQFRAFWTSFDESVDLLASGEVVLEPLPPPALRLLRASRYPVREAAPRTGYRARGGLLFVSREAARDSSRLQACYDYATWWLSGVPGALLLRQGYVNAAQQTSLRAGLVLQDEWDYWIGGEPAGSELATPFGEGSIQTGDVLDGGSLERRACNIALWHSGLRDRADQAADRWAALVEG